MYIPQFPSWFVWLWRHREDSHRFTHPGVACMNVSSAAYIGYLYFAVSAHTPGQTLYFAALVVLYLVSAVFHALPWRPITRTCDQCCIAMVIIAKPMPFLYTEWWAWVWFGGATLLCVFNKHYNLERNTHVSALIFLLIGTISFCLIRFVAFPELDALGFEPNGQTLLVVTLAFVALQAQYHFDWPRPIGRMWSSAETFHFCLFINFLFFINLFVLPYGAVL